MNKKGKSHMTGGLFAGSLAIVGLLLLGGLWMGGVFDEKKIAEVIPPALNVAPGAGQPAAGTTATTANKCANTCPQEDVTIDYNFVETDSNAKAGEEYYYEISRDCGKTWSENSDAKTPGTTLTADNGNIFRVITSTNASATDRYSVVYEDIIGFDEKDQVWTCGGTAGGDIKSPDIATLTLSVTNSDASNTANGATTPEDIALGSSGTLHLSLKGTYQDYFGVCGNLVCLNRNNTAWDYFKITNLGEKVGKPTHVAQPADETTECYNFQNIAGSDWAGGLSSIAIDYKVANSGVDLGFDNTTITVVDSNNVRNTDKQPTEYICAFETLVAPVTDTGGSDATGTIYFQDKP